MAWLGLGLCERCLWCVIGLLWGILSLEYSQGFAVFFSIFELTRRTAIWLRSSSNYIAEIANGPPEVKTHAPRIVHGTVLVTGGVVAGISYELVGRPFDISRRAVHQYNVTHHSDKRRPLGARTLSVFRALDEKLKRDGLLSFVQLPLDPASSPSNTPVWKRRTYNTLRFLGRMGPWGAGFLIWESFGPGLLSEV